MPVASALRRELGRRPTVADFFPANRHISFRASNPRAVVGLLPGPLGLLRVFETRMNTRDRRPTHHAAQLNPLSQSDPEHRQKRPCFASHGMDGPGEDGPPALRQARRVNENESIGGDNEC
jgi:hypothetical protein